MGKEKADSVIESIRKALRAGNKSGGGGGMPDELFFVPKDGVKVVRFLSDLNSPINVVMHNKWNEFMPQPCLRYYGKKCPFHNGGGYKAVTQYCYTIWDYESKSKRVASFPPTSNSPMEDLMEIWNDNGNITDRDVKIIRVVGSDGKSHYKAREVQHESTEFEGSKRNPFSEEKVLQILKGLIRVVKPLAKEDADEDDDD